MNKLIVAGIGPGAYEMLTIQVESALRECDVIAGYVKYVDLLKPYFPEKEILSSPMMKEEERCMRALEKASDGKKVVFVCSGDAGVYGLSGLLYKLAEKFPTVQIEVMPGITAALSGSALLGAPLICDFAVISLSDHLTPWEKISAKLKAAASADFCIVLYNPSSKKRSDYLQRACNLISELIPDDRSCGYVKNIGRQGEEVHICTFSELKNTSVDMFTTVFIGNSLTYQKDGKLITPRGYASEVNA
ncbi:MAG: precorrin-3B C(17)-methyltransferase [Treponema sp.]|nr:precorrin-3B C(17)-methyltransferase [Treponema sp.]